MADILPFKRPSLSDKHRGKSLCREGFHKWVTVTEQQFDVKRGKLITVQECSRCGKRKVTAL